MLKEYEGLNFIDALNVIKQKAVPDAEDISFLRAREAYLTPEEKAVYFEGKTFAEAYGSASGYASAVRGKNDRIIIENRPLVDAQKRIADAEAAGKRAQALAGAPATLEQTQEEREKADKAWADGIKAANAGADQLEENAAAEEERKQDQADAQTEEQKKANEEAGRAPAAKTTAPRNRTAAKKARR